jgi:hypothetical protein
MTINTVSSTPDGPTLDLTRDMPSNVRAVIERNPDIMKHLTDPDFILKLHQATISSSEMNADWCVACGAGATREPVKPK